jgi:cation:H+ antiporter
MNKREFPFLIGMTILIAILGFLFQADAQIVWWEACILLIVFAYYMYLMLTGEKEIPTDDIKVIDMKKAILLLFVGILGVSIGGTMVTRGAEYIAVNGLVTFAGMSITKATTLVGLSVVALGTSLPELVTSVVAAKKGENEIALGNVVGSNVFNTLFIVGLSGIVTPLGLNGDVLIDMIILIVITSIMILFSITKQKITKLEGWILLGIYVSYITLLLFEL